MPRSLWVAELRVSDRTAEKINGLHWLTVDEVRLQVQCVSGLQYVWDEDPERGLRALVKIRVKSADVLVVLYPSTTDPWGETFYLARPTGASQRHAERAD